MKLSLLLWLTSLLPQPVAEQTCLATTVYLEARGESQVGQLAVAEVALRRREHGQWGDTVCKVVAAPKQFAPTLVPGDFAIEDLDSFKQAWSIAARSIDNWKRPADQRRLYVPHADHFAAVTVVPNWSSKRITTIGDHRFYTIN